MSKTYDLMNRIDKLYLAGKFEDVDNEIAILDISKFDTQEAADWLLVTSWAKHELKNYETLAEKLIEHLKIIEPARWENLTKSFWNTIPTSSL